MVSLNKKTNNIEIIIAKLRVVNRAYAPLKIEKIITISIGYKLDKNFINGNFTFANTAENIPRAIRENIRTCHFKKCNL